MKRPTGKRGLPYKDRFADSRPKTFAIISLGCAKNLTLTEEIAARFGLSGYAITPEPTGADLVILNTCGFIGDAREETYSVLDELTKLRTKNHIGMLVVYGCMVQGFLEEMQPRYRSVDLWVGAASTDRLFSLVSNTTKGVYLQNTWDKLSGAPSPRLYLTPESYAYLKLSDGCDNRCAYCSIPRLRGGLRSYPRAHILREARRIVESGRSEIVLIAQDLASYGKDRGTSELADLVPRICQFDPLKWVRMMYLHPAHVSDEIISLYANLPEVVSYIDMPVQHLDDKVLSDMGRKCDFARIKSVLDRLRRVRPDIAVRTSILVGFPTEGKGEFETLMKRLEECDFTHIGVFTYSPEGDTRASAFGDPLSAAEKQDRAAAVMEFAQKRSAARNKLRIGTECEVLIDEVHTDKNGTVSIGRTQYEAPEVDGQVLISGSFEPGAMVRARVTGASDYDLTADFIDFCDPSDPEKIDIGLS